MGVLLLFSEGERDFRGMLKRSSTKIFYLTLWNFSRAQPNRILVGSARLWSRPRGCMREKGEKKEVDSPWRACNRISGMDQENLGSFLEKLERKNRGARLWRECTRSTWRVLKKPRRARKRSSGF
jgi:hypothetical protein